MTVIMDALSLLFPLSNSTSLPACAHSRLPKKSGKQVLGSLTFETGSGRYRGSGRGAAIALKPIFWMNAGNRKTISSLSDSGAPENQVDDCDGESGHELPLVEESLQKTYQDIGMGQWTGLANEKHLSGSQGPVASKVSLCPVNKVHDMGDSVDIADEMQGASTEIDGKRRHLEEDSKEKGTGKLFLTRNKVQELGHEGLIVNQMSTHSEVHDTEAMVINEAYMPEVNSCGGASADYPMSVKVEGYSQHRLYHESHEGCLPIPINQDIATTNITQNETNLLSVKREAWNSSDAGNGPGISQAASVGSMKKLGIWYKSHGHSADSRIKLKDLLPFDSTKDGSEYMRYYDCWLRVGRFKDCLELLECMNRVGALDMNKVYHAKFLEICRGKQAVQEAFRFVKLIENPTLSTFNMLLAVCASAGDVEGAFQVLPLVKKMGLKADCKLYTALISSCAKGGKVDTMFKVFHEMVNAGIEPSIYTYGALIDGCARAGQVAKAFGVYGIMRSKKMKPDRVIFNALITTCGRAGALDRAFDILSEMRAEPHPLDPDHVTIGALINACSLSGQVDRALEVYKMVQKHGIKGTAEVYTMAVSACSKNGDLDFALSVYDDMRKKGVYPDEVFYSALIDAAGHAGDIHFGLKILNDAINQGLMPGNVMYSSLMGACSNAKNWQKALELYEEIKRARFVPTVSTFNALITSLCDVGKLHKSIEILEEMKQSQVVPNSITYTILLIASHKEDEPELAFKLFSRAIMDGVVPNLKMCDCVTSLCLQKFRMTSTDGQSIPYYTSGTVQIHNKWTSWALLVYRQTISAGVTPTMEALSHVLGCLRMPLNTAGKFIYNENLGFYLGSTKRLNLCSLIDGFGIYDPRAFSLYEEAASLGVVPCFPYRDTPVSVDVKDLQVYAAEVYLLTILKGLKHRLAAGAQLFNITLLLPIEKVVVNSKKVQMSVNISGRTGQAVASLLRRLNLLYQGNEAYGKIRISGKAIKHWFRPKDNYFHLSTRTINTHLAKGIGHQQRAIRLQQLSIDDERRTSLGEEKTSLERYQAWDNR
ncbi:pentatricopeptide repeat-containing protein MRL1, chloroplastic isoform X2 [Cryptomeria japonica]|uniref:pentatricopeptide repeat-containing protein MRL1, chloroplastic isoform X2 n=1 Tax=Cryptomeria japonica TaxID=3369 RepID=UPI0025AD89E5|nr:pentatricopeptide repeat-containing protein MRL1, chloroplastic isoform X2 [Cryptomeria japonica]